VNLPLIVQCRKNYFASQGAKIFIDVANFAASSVVRRLHVGTTISGGAGSAKAAATLMLEEM